MDNKKKVQDSLNRSLSGLSENPYLAQRVIAQAKGETKVKRLISLFIAVITISLSLKTSLRKFLPSLTVRGESLYPLLGKTLSS